MKKKLKQILKRLGFVIAAPLVILIGLPLYCLIGVICMFLSVPYYVLTGEDLFDKVGLK